MYYKKSNMIFNPSFASKGLNKKQYVIYFECPKKSNFGSFILKSDISFFINLFSPNTSSITQFNTNKQNTVDNSTFPKITQNLFI